MATDVTPQPDEKKKSYVVVTPVLLDGKRYEPGKKMPSGDHIEALLKSGAVKVAE